MNLWKLPSIVIAPDVIFGGWITNTLFCAWISAFILLVILFFATRRRAMIPSGLQNVVEWAIGLLLGLVETVAGKEKGRKFFPLVASFFLFILVANLLDIIPGVDTIGWVNGASHAGWLMGSDSNKIIPWIRPATTDLNLTIAMALVSVGVTQIFGFQMLGAKEQISKFLNFRALKRNGLFGIVDLFVGLLEIISEVGRVISFSFRLFGNIFAGSVLLAVFAFLVPVVANLIFVPFELFVAAIQAFVFSFLTLLFMELGTSSHDHGNESNEHEAMREVTKNEAREAVTVQGH